MGLALLATWARPGHCLRDEDVAVSLSEEASRVRHSDTWLSARRAHRPSGEPLPHVQHLPAERSAVEEDRGQTIQPHAAVEESVGSHQDTVDRDQRPGSVGLRAKTEEEDEEREGQETAAAEELEDSEEVPGEEPREEEKRGEEPEAEEKPAEEFKSGQQVDGDGGGQNARSAGQHLQDAVHEEGDMDGDQLLYREGMDASVQAAQKRTANRVPLKTCKLMDETGDVLPEWEALAKSADRDYLPEEEEAAFTALGLRDAEDGGAACQDMPRALFLLGPSGARKGLVLNELKAKLNLTKKGSQVYNTVIMDGSVLRSVHKGYQKLVNAALEKGCALEEADDLIHLYLMKLKKRMIEMATDARCKRNILMPLTCSNYKVCVQDINAFKANGYDVSAIAVVAAQKAVKDLMAAGRSNYSMSYSDQRFDAALAAILPVFTVADAECLLVDSEVAPPEILLNFTCLGKDSFTGLPHPLPEVFHELAAKIIVETKINPETFHKELRKMMIAPEDDTNQTDGAVQSEEEGDDNNISSNATKPIDNAPDSDEGHANSTGADVVSSNATSNSTNADADTTLNAASADDVFSNATAHLTDEDAALGNATANSTGADAPLGNATANLTDADAVLSNATANSTGGDNVSNSTSGNESLEAKLGNKTKLTVVQSHANASEGIVTEDDNNDARRAKEQDGAAQQGQNESGSGSDDKGGAPRLHGGHFLVAAFALHLLAAH